MPRRPPSASLPRDVQVVLRALYRVASVAAGDANSAASSFASSALASASSSSAALRRSGRAVLRGERTNPDVMAEKAAMMAENVAVFSAAAATSAPR